MTVRALSLYGAGFPNKLDFSKTHGQTHMLVFFAPGHVRIMAQIVHAHTHTHDIHYVNKSCEAE